MTANEIRKMEIPIGENLFMKTMAREIAAQLAELNEKFADYFETLGPDETDKKRGIR